MNCLQNAFIYRKLHVLSNCRCTMDGGTHADNCTPPRMGVLQTRGRITNSDVQHILGVSKPTASRILQQMNGWLEMQDVTGKSTYYMIKGLPNAS